MMQHFSAPDTLELLFRDNGGNQRIALLRLDTQKLIASTPK